MKLNLPYFLRKPKFSRKSHSTKLYWRKCRKTLQYDKKHSKAVFYTVGTNVLKKDFRKKKRKGGCKLDVMWVGPYLIPKSLGKGFYELQSCGKGPVTTIPRVSHVHIKAFKSLSYSPSRKLQHHQHPMNHLQLLQILHIQYCTPIQTCNLLHL